jgi:hypothetical protein
MYGLSYYVMALQEVEKARLEYRTSAARRDGGPLPDPQGPPPERGCHEKRVPRRRLRRVL